MSEFPTFHRLFKMLLQDAGASTVTLTTKGGAEKRSTLPAVRVP